jgi:hypothetical protein
MKKIPKPKEYTSKLIEDLMKSIPLESKLKTSNEMMFIDLLSYLGYREDKMWDETNEEENNLLRKISEKAEELTKRQIEIFNKWKKDNNS